MSKLQIHIDEDQPFTISGEDDYLRKFISDISYGIEYNGSRNSIVEHTNDDGSEVPIKPLEDNTMTHKPSYDIEVKDRSPNYPDRKYNEFHVYYDIHTQIAHLGSRYI